MACALHINKLPLNTGICSTVLKIIVVFQNEPNHVFQNGLKRANSACSKMSRIVCSKMGPLPFVERCGTLCPDTGYNRTTSWGVGLVLASEGSAQAD